MRNLAQPSPVTRWCRLILPLLLAFAMSGAGAAPLGGDAKDKEKDRRHNQARHLLKAPPGQVKHDSSPHGQAKHDRGRHSKAEHRKRPPAFKLGVDPKNLRALTPDEIQRLVPSRGHQ